MSDGGHGLYVFDITDPHTPTWVATGFDLGYAGYGVAAAGGYLYVVTGNGGAEIHVYDIVDPASLNVDDRVSTINVPASAKARSLVVFGDTLFVASLEDATEKELFAYDIATPASPVLLGSLEDTGSSFTGIGLRNGYTYLSNTSDTAELRVVDVFDPANMQLAPGGGYNVADTPNANAVAAVGGYVLLSRDAGDVTEELHLFDVSSVPVPASAPWNHEVGAVASGLAADLTASYGFVATGNSSKELVVVDLARFAAGQNPEVASYDTTTGAGRGVTYSISHDRVFLLTNKAFIVIKPG